MEITKREIIASIVIISFMLIIGFIISDKISDWQNDKNAEYQKAVHITDTEIFQYGMQTNIGNAFVYGDLLAVDTVTYPEIGGEYIYIEKVKERKERHEREVTEKDSNGKEHKRTEVYYEWETESIDNIHADEIEFCGMVFPYGKIQLPGSGYIDTISGDREWSWKSGERVKVRYKYYGVSTAHIGTIYTDLRNDTISDNSDFYKDCTIDEALKRCTSNIGIIIFWVFWLVLTAGLVYGFYYLENNWLEN